MGGEHREVRGGDTDLGGSREGRGVCDSELEQDVAGRERQGEGETER